MLTAEQLKSSVSTSQDAFSVPAAAASSGEDVDTVWVIAHALGGAGGSCYDVLVMTQVCRCWRDYICAVKDEVYAAILPRRFPRLRYLDLVLEASKQVQCLRKEEQYRRHLQAQAILYPHQEEIWGNLKGRPLIDPDIACMLEVWLDAKPVLFAALSSIQNKKPDTDGCPLTELLKEMHEKETLFLKGVIDGDIQDNMQPEKLAALYDVMNKHCGWDKLSVMMFVSNGDEVVRVCRAPFLLAMHDRYLFGNSLEVPKLVLNQDGMIGLPMLEDQELEVGAMVRGSAVDERVSCHGLQAASQHNGKEGTVSKYVAETGRFDVALDTGEHVAIKPQNLTLATEARAALTVDHKQHIMSLKLFVAVNPQLIAEVLVNFPDPSQQQGPPDAASQRAAIPGP